MARIELQITGGAEAAKGLREVADRVQGGLPPEVRGVLNSLLLTAQQDHYRDQQGPDGPWPSLHWLTVKIRNRYGHSDKATLIRGGDLYASITTLRDDDDELFVGTNLRYARTVHDGGTVTDSRGVTRSIQAFPWAYLTSEEEGDLVETLVTHYTEVVQ